MIRRSFWLAVIGAFAAACVQVVVAPPTPTPTSIPTPTPTPIPTPTPTPIPTPTPTPIPTPTPTPTPIPPQISAETAQAVVRAYFEAIAANDVDRARALTTGQARQLTEQLIVETERQTRAYGATPQFRLDRLALGPTTVKPPDTVVHASFELATGARVGPFAIAGPPIKGDADFTVVRTTGELQVSRIEGQFAPG